MQQHNLPTSFEDTALTEGERTFLDYQDFRMRSVGQQFKLEVGRILKETRDWFHDNHKWGFEDYAQKQWGFDRNQLHYLINAFEGLMDVENFQHLGLSFSAQLALKEAPNQQEAIDEVRIRQELEEKITAKKAKEIAEYQRAELIARDEAKSNQERADALNRQLDYTRRQLLATQKAAAEATKNPKVVEKIVEKQIVPPQMQEHIRKLQEKERQLTRERDSYRQQLHEERSVAQARMLEDLEGENAERINTKFADAMRNFVNGIRVALNHLPSIADTQSFDADSWQRLDEAIEKTAHIARELQSLKYHSSENVHASIVNSHIVEATIL